MTETQAHDQVRWCGAKTRSGGQCKQPALLNGRCRFHGGKSLSGPAHPNFKHGRRSKYFPGRLLERYQEALADPNLISLSDDVALVEARIDELSRQIGGRHPEVLWKTLEGINQRLQTSIRERDTTKTAALLTELEATIKEGAGDAALFQEIFAAQDHKRKLTESWGAQMLRSDQVMTVAQVMMVAQSFLKAVLDNVTDRESITKISQIARDFVLDDPGGRPRR